jgi:hypothetical protein
MSARSLVLGLCAAALCIGAGVGASRWLAAPPPRRPGPEIVLDPRSIQLLPDASLRLELPRGFDAGAP